jgi:hypothetical protein
LEITELKTCIICNQAVDASRPLELVQEYQMWMKVWALACFSYKSKPWMWTSRPTVQHLLPGDKAKLLEFASKVDQM